MKLRHIFTSMAFLAAVVFAATSQAGAISGITAPASAYKGDPVTITVQGTGSCVGYNVNWGDGTSTSPGGGVSFPHSPPAHTYTSTGTKTISVSPVGGLCSGTPSTTIQINTKPLVGHIIPFSKILSINGLGTSRWGKTYRMKVLGNGKCKLRIDWGDGGLVYNANNYDLSAPRYLYHKYKSRLIGISKTYTIKVTPAPVIGFNTCSGSASKSVRVGLFGVAPKPVIKKSPGIRYQVK